MFERRRFLRIPDELEITYKVISDTKTKMFMTKDISQGGIRFFAQEPIPQNSLLEIRLTLKEVPFSFKTVVRTRWVKMVPYGDLYEVGVEFINIPQDAAEHLLQYINTILKKNE